MKLAIRRTYLGDRLCFPDAVEGRLVDVQAAYARMLETRGSHRDDAIPRSRREVAETLPALLQTDPELAVVIGRRSRGLEPGTAMAAVAGYVAFVDTGARDVSELDNHRMDRGKGCDTFAIIGPWFVTADEIPDPHALDVRFWVNGELRQDGSTSEMFHDIPEQLCWLTQALTLAPGDIVSTGTPPGVRSVLPTDRLRGEIQGLGVLENVVVAEEATPGRPTTPATAAAVVVATGASR